MKSVSAEELRNQLLAGDQQPLEYAFDQTQRYCTRTLIKKTGCSMEDAEDIHMDALLIFRENLLSGKLQRLSNLRTYLFGICWNLWRDLNRAREKYRREQNEIERQLWLLRIDDEAVPGPGGGEETAERIRQVTDALGQLRETCRKVLVYVYVEKLSHREIAALLGLAGPDVVKVTRHRCYRQWQKLIEQQKSPPHEKG